MEASPTPAAGTPQPPELFCDLIMKGGITSGVVYPKLITGLATKYTFKNIGGSSAGAIAAAACAAAEFRRLQGSTDGFTELHTLPDELGRTVDAASGSRLQSLFQPSAGLRRHFDILLSALNQPSKLAIVVGVLSQLLWSHWGIVLPALLAALVVIATLVHSTGIADWCVAWAVGLAVSFAWLFAGWVFIWRPAQRGAELTLGKRLLAWLMGGAAAAFAVLSWLNFALGHFDWVANAMSTGSWALAMPLAIALICVLCGWKFVTSLLAGLQANFWGICSGLTTASTGDPRASVPGLTEWLTGYFNGLAGLSPTDRPLTLGDLWDGDRATGGDASVTDDTPSVDRTINLEVMTTAVSRKLPYAIPFRDGAGAFYFDPQEWSRLFPKTVMAWLMKVSVKGKLDDTDLKYGNNNLWRLPNNRHLPVVLLVRMSLSFPVLLSAVPMYAIDRSGKTESGKAKKVWFSDGGIGSNIPLHFFDAPLPQHPTFAVNLTEEHPSHKIIDGMATCDPENGRVYLPDNSLGGLQKYWSEVNDASPFGIFSFLWRIVETMHNWHDETQLPMPGYRDRVVEIAQKANEGGLNLNMPAALITALSDAGACAAEKLIERFYPSTAINGSVGWEHHEEIRIKTFLALAEKLGRHPAMHDPHWRALVASGRLKYTNREGDMATHTLECLAAIGSPAPRDSELDLMDKAPKPRPQWRVTPKI